LIAASQLKHILGVDANGHSLYDLVRSLIEAAGDTNLLTLAIGASTIVFLLWVRSGLKPL
jgi:SulP family sulfate permease